MTYPATGRVVHMECCADIFATQTSKKDIDWADSNGAEQR